MKLRTKIPKLEKSRRIERSVKTEDPVGEKGSTALSMAKMSENILEFVTRKELIRNILKKNNKFELKGEFSQQKPNDTAFRNTLTLKNVDTA